MYDEVADDDDAPVERCCTYACCGVVDALSRLAFDAKRTAQSQPMNADLAAAVVVDAGVDLRAGMSSAQMAGTANRSVCRCQLELSLVVVVAAADCRWNVECSANDDDVDNEQQQSCVAVIVDFDVVNEMVAAAVMLMAAAYWRVPPHVSAATSV